MTSIFSGLAALAAPSAVPAHPRADLLVVEKKADSVGFYDSAGRRVGAVAVGATPHEVAFSTDGRFAYVSDNGVLWMDYDGPGGNTVSVVDLALRRRVAVLPLGRFHRPHGIGIDPFSSRAFVTSENPDRIVLVDLDALAVIKDFDNGGVDPHMVTFGPDGWGYVSNTGSGTVGAVHAASGELRLIEVGAGPQGSLVSQDGSKLWVTCRDEGRIDVIDMDSKSVSGSIATGDGVNRVVATANDELLVYSLQSGRAVGIADPAEMREVAQIPLGGSPLSISLSRDGRHAFAGVQDEDQIWIVSVTDRRVAQVIDTPAGAGPDPVVEIGSYAPSRARP